MALDKKSHYVVCFNKAYRTEECKLHQSTLLSLHDGHGYVLLLVSWFPTSRYKCAFATRGSWIWKLEEPFAGIDVHFIETYTTQECQFLSGSTHFRIFVSTRLWIEVARDGITQCWYQTSLQTEEVVTGGTFYHRWFSIWENIRTCIAISYLIIDHRKHFTGKNFTRKDQPTGID